MERQAASLVSKLPEFRYSSADVMAYLLQYNSMLDAALENANALIMKMSKEKKKKLKEGACGCDRDDPPWDVDSGSQEAVHAIILSPAAH